MPYKLNTILPDSRKTAVYDSTFRAYSLVLGFLKCVFAIMAVV